LSVDGSTVEDVHRQLTGVPESATHIVMSAGGNNAATDGTSRIIR